MYNRTDQQIDLSGWLLSDSSRDLRKYSIPAATIVPPHGYIVFDEQDFNPGRWDPALAGFGLDSDGEDVILSAANEDTGQLYIVDHVRCDAARMSESFGRWPDGVGPLYPMSHLTLGELNSGPRVGPVVISELMYHPRQPGVTVEQSDFEFIEVHNPGPEIIDLTNWQITDGVQFQFAPGTTLEPRDFIVVTSFDPADVSLLTTFRRHYGMDQSVTVMGPFSGQLSNRGESLQLWRPEMPGQPGGEPLLLEDVVSYDDQAPWPNQADGYGYSLQRLGATSWGNDPQAWVAASPTLGAGRLAAGDADGNGQFDRLDIVRVLQAAKYRTGQPATWEEGDWNNDSMFDQLDIIAALQTGNYLRETFAAREDAALTLARNPAVDVAPLDQLFALLDDG